MARWLRVGRAFEILLVAFVVAIVAGQILGQPILVGFVTSGSMEPTLSAGDGFVAVPAAISGPIEEGDVVVFDAQTINDGGLTTHRVTEVTDRGYVTRGDANPFTDQDGGEPPVKPTQVVATAWQPGGGVLVIPHVGTVVEGSRAVLEATQRQLAITFGMRSLLGIQGLAYLLFALTAVFYVVDVWRGDGRSMYDRVRSRTTGTDVRLVVGALTLLLVASATAAMVVPAGAQQFDVISAESDAPGHRVIEMGTTERFRYHVSNGGLLPVVSYLDPATDGVSATSSKLVVDPRSVGNATVALSAPPETGHYREYLVEHRYLLVLPPAVIDGLYEIHPWLPLLAIDALLGGVFYVLASRIAGTGRLRSRSRRDRARA